MIIQQLFSNHTSGGHSAALIVQIRDIKHHTSCPATKTAVLTWLIGVMDMTTVPTEKMRLTVLVNLVSNNFSSTANIISVSTSVESTSYIYMLALW